MYEDQVENFFKEVLRVTRVGGQIHIVPITTIQNRFAGSYNDPNIFVSNKIQIKTIEILEKLKQDSNIEIVLGRNYKAMGPKQEERLKGYAPTLLTIKKLE